MSRYEHLPLFKKTYEFNLYFVRLSRGFPKDFKYGMAAEIRELCLKIIDNIVLANNNVNKAEYLENILSVIERIKVKIRLLKDLKVIKTCSYKYSFEILIDLSKQTTAWKNWSDRDEHKVSSKKEIAHLK
jgi:hypothetical protein